MYTHRVFCRKWNSQELLLQSFFFIIIHILGGIESRSLFIFLFHYIIIFHRFQSFELLTSILGGDRYVHRQVFYRKWNSQQLLLQAFIHIIGIFGSIEPFSQFIFLFQYIILFQTWQSFEPSSSILGRDRQGARSFFVRNWFLNNFCVNLFFI